MADALDRCGRAAEPQYPANPAFRLACSVLLIANDPDRLAPLLSGHHFDLVAVGFGQAHAPAAARLVESFDAGGTWKPREALQIFLVLGVVGEADELRAAFLRHVQMMVIVGAAHVERSRCAFGADEAEMREELLHLVEVGCFHPRPGKFRCLDDGHCFLRFLEER